MTRTGSFSISLARRRVSAYTGAAPSSILLLEPKGDSVKTRSIVMTFVLCLLALTAGFAQNPNMGTWKLNEAKSKIPAGVGKNTTVVYSAAGIDIKVTTDGVNVAGQPAHTEWTGKFDAKPYPVTGDPNVDFRAYKTKGDRMLLLANMKGNKTVSNGKVELAKDGKGRTLSITNFTADNKKVHAKYVYDKQ